MISIADIHRAIRETLEYRLPAIKVEKSDIENPPRPSIFINFVTDKDKQITTRMEKKSVSFDVIYFAELNKERYENLLLMQDTLSNIFKCPVETEKDGEFLSLDISNIEQNLNKPDGVLNTLIDFEINQEIDEDILDNHHSRFDKAVNTNTELMEELITKEME